MYNIEIKENIAQIPKIPVYPTASKTYELKTVPATNPKEKHPCNMPILKLILNILVCCLVRSIL